MSIGKAELLSVRLALIANHATAILSAGASAPDGIDQLVDLRNEIEVTIDQWEREMEKAND